MPRHSARQKPVSKARSITQSNDSFQNAAAKLGVGADNMQSESVYALNPITRNRQKLDNMYRGSWVVRVAIDSIADDMTRAGIQIQSTLEPDDMGLIYQVINDLGIYKAINKTIKWSRLYGGALAVLLIDGQLLSAPLNIESVSKGRFKGIYPLDRWMVAPNLSSYITEYGPNFGKPEFYTVVAGVGPLSGQVLHHTRVIRIDGDDLPFYSAQSENSWSLSVIEPFYDRLVAFDSATTGAAQAAYRLNIRTMKIKGFHAAISAGGKSLDAITASLELIRKYQSSEGLTVIDDDNTFEMQSYNLNGVSDLLLQLMQQVSGAVKIPLIRFFGQPPSGLNSTGESDLRNYYDTVSQQQETSLRLPWKIILELTYRTIFGMPAPYDLDFVFRPLWQMSEVEKSTIAASYTDSIMKAKESGAIDQATALKELKQQSKITGLWSNITDEMIEDAINNPPMPEMEFPLDLSPKDDADAAVK